MKHVFPDTVRAHIAFAEAAARHFKAHPEHWTFSADEISPGCLLALRWGLGDDCVLVVKLDDYDEPTVYGELIRTVAPAAASNAP